MTCLLVSGCGKPLPLPVEARALPCPRPAVPAMKRLDAREGVCSRRNETAKAANASALRGYVEGLEAALECYERQGEVAKLHWSPEEAETMKQNK